MSQFLRGTVNAKFGSARSAELQLCAGLGRLEGLRGAGAPRSWEPRRPRREVRGRTEWVHEPPRPVLRSAIAEEPLSTIRRRRIRRTPYGTEVLRGADGGAPKRSAELGLCAMADRVCVSTRGAGTPRSGGAAGA